LLTSALASTPMTVCINRESLLHATHVKPTCRPDNIQASDTGVIMDGLETVGYKLEKTPQNN